jgi:hypothetical protein
MLEDMSKGQNPQFAQTSPFILSGYFFTFGSVLVSRTKVDPNCIIKLDEHASCDGIFHQKYKLPEVYDHMTRMPGGTHTSSLNIYSLEEG